MTEHSPENSIRTVLFTDLYELTMAQAYQAEGLHETAVFELFFRELPLQRNFVMAAGLSDVLDWLEQIHVTEDDLDYLREQGIFREEFLDFLRGFRFTGDVCAVPEGTIVFPNEPIVQVVAPLIEAQLIETLVLNQIHFQSVLATKAARVVMAAEGRNVVDFGSRRAHGIDAALKAARVSYLAGAVGTSNVLAGKLYDIPIFGTMAHSYIQAHDDEADAFETFARLYPKTTLLVDTYETLPGLRKVIELCHRWGASFQVGAIRLDSGDIEQLAKESRRLLDEAGLRDVRIFVSSEMDEYRIAELLRAGAPIDGFGVGTKMVVSVDAPDLDVAYKLVEFAGQGRTKLSAHKPIYPGRKQVFRVVAGGKLVRDHIGRFDEQLEGEPLLQCVMRSGERTEAGRIRLDDARVHARRELDQLPETLRSLSPSDSPFPVQISEALQTDFEQLRQTRQSP